MTEPFQDFAVIAHGTGPPEAGPCPAIAQHLASLEGVGSELVALNTTLDELGNIAIPTIDEQVDRYMAALIQAHIDQSEARLHVVSHSIGGGVVAMAVKKLAAENKLKTEEHEGLEIYGAYLVAPPITDDIGIGITMLEKMFRIPIDRSATAILSIGKNQETGQPLTMTIPPEYWTSQQRTEDGYHINPPILCKEFGQYITYGVTILTAMRDDAVGQWPDDARQESGANFIKLPGKHRFSGREDRRGLAERIGEEILKHRSIAA